MPQKESQRQWYIRNRERLLLKAREYRIQNLEKTIECSKKWVAKNRDHVRQRQRNWYLRNKEEILKDRKQYRAENKDRINAATKKALMESPKRRETRRRIYARYTKNNPVKVKARRILKAAIRKGIVIRPSECSECKISCKPEAHHHKGYSDEYALDVLWVCKKCHWKFHA